MKNLLKQFGLIIMILGMCWSCVPEEEDPIPPNIYDLEAEYWNESVELNWKNPRYRDRNKTIISYFNNGEEVLEINPAYNTITIENLINDQEYTFTFITEDYLGNKSEEISITETPKEINIYKIQAKEIENGLYKFDQRLSDSYYFYWTIEFESTNMQLWLNEGANWAGFWERRGDGFVRHMLSTNLEEEQELYDSSAAFCFDFDEKTFFYDLAWEKRSGEPDQIEGVYVSEGKYLVDNSIYLDTIFVYSDNTIKYVDKYGDIERQIWNDANLKNKDIILIEYRGKTYLYWNESIIRMDKLRSWEKQ